MASKDKKKKALKLFKGNGGNVNGVAKKLGVSWNTAKKWIDDALASNSAASDKKEEILKEFVDLVVELGRYPTGADFESVGIKKTSIAYYYGSMEALREEAIELHSDVIHQHVVDEHVLFTPHRLDKIDERISEHKRFFITTIVSGKPAHEGFFGAIKNYCEMEGAHLLALVCLDAWDRKRGSGWSIDPSLAEVDVIGRDVRLHDNFLLSTIKISAKQINPTTGLGRIGQREGNFVYASPKQFLEYTATSKHKFPHAMMTPGAVTMPDYNMDRYMSQRSSYIAENDHVLGGIIVEIDDDDQVHFRQVQASMEDGSFVDIDKRYHEDGSVTDETVHLVLGDWHAGATDPGVIDGVRKLCNDITVSDIFLHDFFDGFTISHHDTGKPGIKARRYRQGWYTLLHELEYGANDINMLLNLCDGKLVMVKSNHDEVLKRWLEEHRFVDEPQNYRIGLDLAAAEYDGLDPNEYAYNKYTSISDPDRIMWLQRDDEYKIAGVELAAHGDLGSNGSKGSLYSIEKAYGQSVIGHAHTAAIVRGVFRVGTSSRMDLEYNRGPSSWTHTACLVHEDGSRQLINFTDGKWRR